MITFKKKEQYDVTCIVGLPGVGKTSTAQLIAIDYLEQEKNVWSTVPLAGAFQVDVDKIGTFDWVTKNADGSLKRGGVLLVDEAGLVANNREWKGFPKPFLEFMKYHRHYQMDVYFFSQGVDMDVSIRRLASRWFKFCNCRIPLIGHNYVTMIPVEPILVIENGQWVIKYIAHDGFFDVKRLPIHKAWGLFDSFSVPEKPVIEFKKWYEYVKNKKEKINLKDRLKYIKKMFFVKCYKFFHKKLWGKDEEIKLLKGDFKNDIKDKG